MAGASRTDTLSQQYPERLPQSESGEYSRLPPLAGLQGGDQLTIVRTLGFFVRTVL